VAQADRLSENGRAAQARKLYEKALAIQPNGLEAITGLGYCDLDGEKFMSAIDHFKRALAIAPGNGEAIIGVAEAYKSRGDRQQAVEWYKKYLATLPNGPKATMAKNNVRDLEPQKREVETTTVPASDTAKAPDEAKTKAEDKPAPLPRLPTNDEPPP
jgi:tetratricopeptide (TPR) repeat protein